MKSRTHFHKRAVLISRCGETMIWNTLESYRKDCHIKDADTRLRGRFLTNTRTTHLCFKGRLRLD